MRSWLASSGTGASVSTSRTTFPAGVAVVCARHAGGNMNVAAASASTRTRTSRPIGPRWYPITQLAGPRALVSTRSVAELAPGVVIAGRFQLDRRIGEGGMGFVWAATHLVTRKPLALKMLKPESAADPSLRLRFFREARAACAVRHPNILEIHDVIELEDGTPVMVMDLLHGESLGTRLDRQPVLPPSELARLMLPVVSAVGTAHASGIVHRDLKPDNIFVADEGDGTLVKVLDFGIAKVFAVETSAAGAGGLTGTGAILGTPYYMAPEQIFGERDIDHRADIWALGVILYECLSGRRPTEADNVGQILKIVATDALVPLEVAAPGVPADLAALVGKMLSRDCRARPQDLGEVLATLQRYTEMSVRSFPAPAISATSLPPSAQSGHHAAVVPAQDSGSVRVGSGAVSGTAATLASTTADRSAASPGRGRSSRVTVAAGIAAVVLGAVGVVGVRALRPTSPTIAASTSRPAVDVAPPPVAASTTTTIAQSSATAAASVDVSAHVLAVPAPSASHGRPSELARQHSGVQPIATAATTATATAAAPRPAPSPVAPGGVVEKPPF